MQTLNKYIRQGKESETLLINQVSLLRASKNEEVFKFGFGQSPFPVPQKITDSLASAAHRKEYMSVQGHLPLRQAIAQFHNEVEERNLHEDNIVIGAGSKILLFSILAAFNKAEIVLPAPSWVSYEPQANILGHNVDWIETNFDDKWGLTPDALDKYCQQRPNPDIPLILVLNYPNNPTGQSFTKNELMLLTEVLRKHSVVVIADEIYSLLTFGERQASIADYYPEGSIITSGLSKWCGAGGWRLGFAHIPKELGSSLFQAVIGVASETYSCAPAPIQIAATTAYNERKLAKNFLAKQIKILTEVGDFCASKLQESNIKVHSCVGGFYLFPDFSQLTSKFKRMGIRTSSELTAVIMENTGVALLPGSAFGMDNKSLTARLAFVDFDGSQVLGSSDTCTGFNKVKLGIKKLCNWLDNL